MASTRKKAAKPRRGSKSTIQDLRARKTEAVKGGALNAGTGTGAWHKETVEITGDQTIRPRQRASTFWNSKHTTTTLRRRVSVDTWASYRARFGARAAGRFFDGRFAAAFWTTLGVFWTPLTVLTRFSCAGHGFSGEHATRTVVCLRPTSILTQWWFLSTEA